DRRAARRHLGADRARTSANGAGRLQPGRDDGAARGAVAPGERWRHRGLFRGPDPARGLPRDGAGAAAGGADPWRSRPGGRPAAQPRRGGGARGRRLRGVAAPVAGDGPRHRPGRARLRHRLPAGAAGGGGLTAGLRLSLHSAVTSGIEYCCDERSRFRFREPPVTVHVSLESCPALVLNADYRPLSYYPLSLWSWQDAIKAICLDRVHVVQNYDRIIKSPSFEMLL